MKIIIGIVMYFILSGSFLFKTNGRGLNIQNSAEIKGISAVLIVLGHCTNCFSNSKLGLFNAGIYIVAVFFFISGYGVAFGCKNKPDYLKGFLPSRIIKVLMPFLIAHIIYIPVKMLCGESLSSDTFLYSLMGKNTIVSNSWYCLAVVLMYIVFWLCFKLFKKDISKFIALTAAVLLLTACEYFFYTRNFYHWFVSNLSFVFGVAFAFFDLSKIKKQFIIIFSSLGLVGSCAVVPFFNAVSGEYSFAAETLACNLQTAFFALLISTLIPVFQYNNRITTFLGNFSYEIYLYHGLFIYLLRRIDFFSGNFPLLFAAVFICTIAVSVPMSYVNKKAVNLLLKNKKS